ncbi:hypothetical protein [Polaromonas sp. YR568]|uniref:hypothetical protein n=1 Tax=Polaromonas sp. YR568 TaxID=1855301 RepID=UPI00398C1B4F
MTLHRSDKARDELASRNRVLNLRERSALFLADGLRTHEEVQALLQDDGAILRKLMADGYLFIGESPQAAESARPAFQNTEPGTLAPAQPGPPTQPPDTAAKGADNFEGKRSLATTRMFLFDICERMFVRKMPAMANHYRDQLREARTRESMVAIARDIILNVEELAGPERADGLRERIAMLLPSEQ